MEGLAKGGREERGNEREGERKKEKEREKEFLLIQLNFTGPSLPSH